MKLLQEFRQCVRSSLLNSGAKFYEITGCPIIINTSFNARGEPIVCDTTDAYKCFMSTEIDMLVVGNCLLYKNKQKALSKKNHNEEYHLD